LKPLTRRNAVRLTHERFRAEAQALIEAVERVLRSKSWLPLGRRRSARDGVAMTNQLYESDVAKAISYPLVVALGALLTWLATLGSATIGAALAALLAILGGVSFLAFSLMYRRYLGILSAAGDREGSPERDSYKRLRASLARGGLAARLFIRRLTKFLDAIDHFFGDANIADRTLFPHADAGAALDSACLRPLSVSYFDLSYRNDFCFLDRFRLRGTG
jgi:hypothetical protein